MTNSEEENKPNDFNAVNGDFHQDTSQENTLNSTMEDSVMISQQSEPPKEEVEEMAPSKTIEAIASDCEQEKGNSIIEHDKEIQQCMKAEREQTHQKLILHLHKVMASKEQLKNCKSSGVSSCCAPIHAVEIEAFMRLTRLNFETVYDMEEVDDVKLTANKTDFEGYSAVQDFLIKNFDIDSKFPVCDQAFIRCASLMIQCHTLSLLAGIEWTHESFHEWRKSYTKLSGWGILKSHKAGNSKKKAIKTTFEMMAFVKMEDLSKKLVKDLQTLSKILRQKKFFMGAVPCSLDCMVFALVSHILLCQRHTPNQILSIVMDEVTKYTYGGSLFEHHLRMRKVLWPYQTTKTIWDDSPEFDSHLFTPNSHHWWPYLSDESAKDDTQTCQIRSDGVKSCQSFQSDSSTRSSAKSAVVGLLRRLSFRMNSSSQLAKQQLPQSEETCKKVKQPDDVVVSEDGPENSVVDTFLNVTSSSVKNTELPEVTKSECPIAEE